MNIWVNIVLKYHKNRALFLRTQQPETFCSLDDAVEVAMNFRALCFPRWHGECFDCHGCKGKVKNIFPVWQGATQRLDFPTPLDFVIQLPVVPHKAVAEVSK